MTLPAASLPDWPWLGLALSAAFALHGAWRALRAPFESAPRPGIVEFGIGVGGIAMLLPRAMGVHFA